MKTLWRSFHDGNTAFARTKYFIDSCAVICGRGEWIQDAIANSNLKTICAGFV